MTLFLLLTDKQSWSVVSRGDFQCFCSLRGFNVNVSSLLDEEEPVFSSLLQVNDLVLTQSESLMSFIEPGVGCAAGARPWGPEARPGEEEAGEDGGC